MKTLTAAMVTATIALAGCGGSESSDAYCERAAAAKEAFDTNGEDDLAVDDPAVLEEQFTAVTSSVSALADAAPDELADEFALIVNNYDELLEGFRSVDFDFVAFLADPDLAEIVERLESGETDAATDTIDEYTQAECGFVLEDESSTDESVPGESVPSESSTDESSTDESVPDVGIPLDSTTAAQIAAVYQETFGLDDAQTGCLADQMVEMGGDATEAMSDSSAVISMLAACDISMADISEVLAS